MNMAATIDLEEGLEQLSVLVASLRHVDPAVLDDTALHHVTISLQRLHGQLGVVAGQTLAAWETRGVWASDQSRTSNGRLSRELNCSARTAKATLRRARQLADVPATVAAVHAGVLSPDHIGLLAAARTVAPDAFAADEATLVGHCTTLRYPDAERVVAYWKLHVDPDGAAADADQAAEASHAHCSETFDGTVVVDASFDPIGGLAFSSELRVSPTRSASPTCVAA